MPLSCISRITPINKQGFHNSLFYYILVISFLWCRQDASVHVMDSRLQNRVYVQSRNGEWGTPGKTIRTLVGARR